MTDAILLVANNGINIDVLNAFENIAFYKRVHLLQVADQFLNLHTLGAVLVVAGGTGICKLACALDKMQVIVIPPCLDVLFTHQIQRTDQLHPLKIRPVKLRHHSLNLRAVKHSHKNGLNYIIIMMAAGNLVAAHFFCKGI